MKVMDRLPIEIIEQILWHLGNDSLALHRAERVCQTWADIIQFFEVYKKLRWRSKKVILSLHTFFMIALNRILLLS